MKPLLILYLIIGVVMDTSATQITWTVSGVINSIRDDGNRLDGSVVSGTSYTMLYVFDSETPDSSPSDAGHYITSTSGNYGISAVVGNYEINSTGDFRNVIYPSLPPEESGDYFHLYPLNSGYVMSNGVDTLAPQGPFDILRPSAGSFGINLYDYDGQWLSDDAARPLSPPTLESLEVKGFFFEYYDLTETSSSPRTPTDILSLSGTITNIDVTTVPLPGAAWLFGSALLGLGAMKRRRAQHS